MKYYVDASAARTGSGTKDSPFQTIREAALIALPGDEVLVAPGLYREYVDPANGGTKDAPIVYRSLVRAAPISPAPSLPQKLGKT